MKIFRFDQQVGQKINHYNSNFIMSKVTKLGSEAVIGCMHLEENGVIGFHKAVMPQLLLIVNGEGWVTGKEQTKIQVRAGDAVFWEKGEGHQTMTDTFLTAIVIEAKELKPEEFMPLKEVANR
ncbi:cupin [Psychrobacillus sp. BL-248-WT-3]|uniref:cupin n=1 Tax=Psychrobacillus sp. BL-248-WT-3 TaxID=2725306 RepID=UPI00146F0F2C|nr:cupin [Psychrobacillus sp. BL-248-WT-3]NME04423.1 cupin [Psychrobacillus sp. BL-248-WT-3]